MTSFLEDDLLPNECEERVFCSAARVCTEGRAVRIQCASSTFSVKGSTHSWYKHHIANVMYACIILHNMIIHDEGQRASDWSDDEAGPSVGHATPLVVRGLPYGVSERLQAQESMSNQQAHLQLMNVMIEEVWIRSGS
ncbi:uncharacterized protein LOC121773600 [Salvia splendens]|uniref:uncharacterized protein LOC121773600 n=1 Tax=Salvia splendens TaxID=180675 RepID=UPI001C2605DE|nr:uncharacterized protein LOC121773600 [Salvia splendens]